MSAPQSEVRACGIPSCDKKACSVKRRGANSPIADKSKRSRWCRFHLKGRGKQERINWQLSSTNSEANKEKE